MELRHLKYFLAVADELNFRRAAEKLFITQPPLTRQIQELEREMGVTLFDRSGNRIKLTSAGIYLRGEARLMLDRADEVKRLALSVQSREHSRLRVGFVESVLQAFLPDIFAAVIAAAPGIGIELFEMHTEEQIDALLHDRIDAGFVRNWGQIEEVDYERILDESLIAICSPKLLKGISRPSLKDLAALPFMAFSRLGAPGLVERIEEVFFLNDFLPKVVFEGGQLDMIRRLVQAGLGWAIVPACALSSQELDGTLVLVEIAGLKRRIELGIALSKGKRNPNLDLLLDVSRKRLSALSIMAKRPEELGLPGAMSLLAGKGSIRN